MTIAAWLFGAGGVVLLGIGAFFIFVRPSLLPEDLRFLGRSGGEIDEFVPQLRMWLRRVFVVLGGHALTVGILTIFVAAMNVHDGDRAAVVVLAFAGATSIGLMTRRQRRSRLPTTRSQRAMPRVRPAATHGAGMPVPAAHRTFESQDLSGLGGSPYLERLTHRTLGSGESVQFNGPAAIVVLDGQASVTAAGRTTDLSAQSGATIAAGDQASVRAGSGTARVLVLELVRGG